MVMKRTHNHEKWLPKSTPNLYFVQYVRHTSAKNSRKTLVNHMSFHNLRVLGTTLGHLWTQTVSDPQQHKENTVLGLNSERHLKYLLSICWYQFSSSLGHPSGRPHCSTSQAQTLEKVWLRKEKPCQFTVGSFKIKDIAFSQKNGSEADVGRIWPPL